MLSQLAGGTGKLISQRDRGVCIFLNLYSRYEHPLFHNFWDMKTEKATGYEGLSREMDSNRKR
jgi:hypothetical protein